MSRHPSPFPPQPAGAIATAYDTHRANIRRRRAVDIIFAVVGTVFIVISLGVLVALLGSLLHDGFSRLRPDFLTSYPSRRAAEAGIKSAIAGTTLVMLVTAVTAIPLGVAAGIYLEEYARKNWVTDIIEINIANLAGIPSIIWGLMALGLLIYGFEHFFGDPDDGVTGFGRSILTAGLTLGLLVLPIVIVATRESIRSIPQAIREASYACGSTRLQTVRYHVLPYSMPGVLTGSIIALSRAIGETAPLITIGALTFIAFLPPVPFTERAWLNATTSKLTVPSEAAASPLTSPKAAIPGSQTLRTGAIVIRSRDPEGKNVEEVRLDFRFDQSSADPSLEQIRDRFSAVPQISAIIGADGRLQLESKYPHRFIIASDTTNLLRVLKINGGGDRYGPLEWIHSEFTVLPIQMFNWVSRPDQSFHANAAASGVVLLVVTLAMNGVAIVLRYRLRRNLQW